MYFNDSIVLSKCVIVHESYTKDIYDKITSQKYVYINNQDSMINLDD